MLARVGITSCINFKRALNSDEEKEFIEVDKKAANITGPKDKSILIIHDPCLPQNPAENTGTGHLASEESIRFFELMKNYLGINTVEVLPQGQLSESPNRKGVYRPYSAPSLSLGNHIIYPKLLTTPEYDSILESKDIENIVKENTTQSLIDNLNLSDVEKPSVNNETIVNFKNIVKDNSPFEIALRKAYDKFETSNSTKVTEIKNRFESYKKENDDWLEPKGLYEVLKHKHNQDFPPNWNDEIDKNLYNPDFDEKIRKKRIDDIKTNNSKEIEYYKFKQFLADEHLAIGRKKLNEKGMKLFGDCPIGFYHDEVWANPKAFKNEIIHWKFKALDFDTIKDENSASAKLLKRKIGLYAKRYDGIRLDASWIYAKPKLLIGKEKNETVLNMGSHVLDMIDQTVKEIKGKDFDLKNIIHEFEADRNDFDAFENTPHIIPPLQNRVKIYTSLYMNTDFGGWGSNEAFTRRFDSDRFIIGPGNHDGIPLRQLAELSDPMGKENMEHWSWQKKQQIPILADILKLDAKKLAENPLEFVKAKFAEPFMAKNSMVFYMDVFGRKERFNSHYDAKSTDYSYKISDKFEKEYHQAVQEGYGFNKMDSYEKIFKAKGYDKTHPELYNSIVKFRDILSEKGVLTKEEANKAFKPQESSKTIEKTKNKYTPFIIAGATIAVILVGALMLLKQKNSSSNNSDAK